MTTVEEELTRTLARAASVAPEPDPGFLAGVRRRQRLRRRKRVLALAAGAVMLTTGGTATAFGLDKPPPPPEPVPTTWSGTVPDLRTARPAEEVWPEAVHKLPGTLPDGHQYEVVDVIGPDRYLVDALLAAEPGQVGSPDRVAVGPSIFDAKANTVLPLYDPAVEVEPRSFSTPSTVRAGDHAVWAVTVRVDEHLRQELWSARLDGEGSPRRLVRLDEYDRIDSAIGVAGDGVYWARESGRGSMGIYRLPLSGGQPRLVPGTEGYRPFELSPWITTSQHGEVTEEAEKPAPRRGELWNLVTGERRTWSTPADTYLLSCDPVLCSGTQAREWFVQRPDGTDHQTVPFSHLSMKGAHEGRFGVGSLSLTIGTMHFVWDRFTGKAAVTGMGSVGPAWSRMSRGYERTLMMWPDLRGAYYLLDLKAIR